MSCSVETCPNRNQKNPSVLLFNLPTNLYYQKLWRNRFGGKEIRKPHKFLVCSEHFDDDDFDITEGHKVLKSGALPSRNLPYQHFKPPKRKSKKTPTPSPSTSESESDHTIEQIIPEQFEESLKSERDVLQEAEDTFNETTQENDKGVIHKHRLLFLEFELLQDHVRNQESLLLRLKEENSALNLKLEKIK